MGHAKLPNLRRILPHRSMPDNAWVTSDRIETLKSVALILVITAVLLGGVWLIVAGLSR